MKEILVSGKHYRVLADSVNNIWHRISYWTKASDVEFDDGSRLEGKVFGHAILERGKDYAKGDIAYCTNAPSWVRLVCTEAGKTATAEPNDYKSIANAGVMIHDGTATFEADDIRPAQVLSNSTNQAPSVALLKNTCAEAIEAANEANKVNLYVGEDNKLHFVDKEGADSALNFKLHDATYTFGSNGTSSIVDLGTRHKYRYVNAQNIYNKGVADGIGSSASGVKQIQYTYHHHTIDNTNVDSADLEECPYPDDYQLASPSGCFTTPYYHIYQKTHHSENRAAAMSLVDGHWVCSVCGGIEGDSGTSTSPTNQHYHTVQWDTVDKDYWTTDESATPKTETRYICSCGKLNGQIVKQQIDFN